MKKPLSLSQPWSDGHLQWQTIPAKRYQGNISPFEIYFQCVPISYITQSVTSFTSFKALKPSITSYPKQEKSPFREKHPPFPSTLNIHIIHIWVYLTSILYIIDIPKIPHIYHECLIIIHSWYSLFTHIFQIPSFQTSSKSHEKLKSQIWCFPTRL